jgi:hypothetical protein
VVVLQVYASHRAENARHAAEWTRDKDDGLDGDPA